MKILPLNCFLLGAALCYPIMAENVVAINPAEPGTKIRQFFSEAFEKQGLNKDSLLSIGENLAWQDSMHALPIIQYMEALHPEYNSTLILRGSEVTIAYMGEWEPNTPLKNHALLKFQGQKISAAHMVPAYESEALSKLANAVMLSKQMNSGYIESHLAPYNTTCENINGDIFCYTLPAAFGDTALVGGGIKIILDSNLNESSAKKKILHPLLKNIALGAKTIAYSPPANIPGFSEVDYAQALIVRRMWLENKNGLKDLDSNIVHYIGKAYQELKQEIEKLSSQISSADSLRAHVKKVQIMRNRIFKKIDLAKDFSPRGALPPNSTAKPAFWEHKLDSLEVHTIKAKRQIQKTFQNQDREAELLALDSMATLWANAQPATYSYMLKRNCYCSATFVGPFAVQYQDGTLFDVKHKAIDERGKVRNTIGGSRKFSTSLHFGAYDINSIFREIRKFIEYEKPHFFSVEYDSQYFYPKLVKIDPNIFTNGDEISLQIGKLNVLNEIKNDIPSPNIDRIGR